MSIVKLHNTIVPKFNSILARSVKFTLFLCAKFPRIWPCFGILTRSLDPWDVEQNIQSRLFSNYSYRVIRKVTKHFQTVYNRWKGVRTPQNLPLICNRPDFSFLVFSSISSLPLHPRVVLGPARSLGSEIFLLNSGKSKNIPGQINFIIFTT